MNRLPSSTTIRVILEQDLEHSPWLLPEHRYAITVARAEAVIRAVDPTAKRARLLAVKPGTSARTSP